MTTREKVLEFIYRRFPEDCHWADGNCYYFAVILKARFPNGEIYYDVVDGHFVFQLEDLYFDWNGTCLQYDIDNRLKEHLYKWSEFHKIDSEQYKRIIQDVIR